MRPRIFDCWTILILLGVGAFMFWGAGHYSIFDDEGFSCRRYTMPLGEMVSALWHGEEPDPPLYYILQNIWVHIFGVGPLGLRSLSIVMFLVGLLFIRLSRDPWSDDRAAALAMFIAAVHPAHLLFGLAGRWYSTMFCLVAILFWATDRLARRTEASWGSIASWVVIAAAVCYTNYFGVVMVGFLLLVYLLRHPDRSRWLKAGLGVLILYAVWIPAFWAQATSFPQFRGSMTSYTASALRVMAALGVGNFASPAAWWIWASLFVSCISCILLLKSMTGQARPAPLSTVIGLSFIAGIISRTLIDKYVMVLSGPICVMAASAWIRTWRNTENRWTRRLARVAAVSLGLAWFGCYVNLITERHWSSLRWLDPWETALADLEGDVPATEWIISQPAARYYHACMMSRREGQYLLLSMWRWYAMPPQDGIHPDAAATPESMLERMKTSNPKRVATIRGAEFADSPDWVQLQAILDDEYVLTDERKYLQDPDVKWKDRLDPTFKHPAWRITVRVYERRTRP